MAATVWKGRLAFGMVSIPVRLYKAARRERIRFHQVYRREETPYPASTTDESKENAPPTSSSSLQESPRLIPAGGPAAETVARVRNMLVGDTTEEAVEKSKF